MPKSKHRITVSGFLHPRRPSTLTPLIFFGVFLTAAAAPTRLHAQLPAGTTDAASQPQPDPLLTQANEALAKQDYPAALKLLTTLAEKNPNNPQILYNLASTQDALDQTTNAEATYRRAITADPNYFDPHLALGLLLARNNRRTEARTELLKATTLNTDNSALKARAYRALARLDQASNPATASDELLQAIKLSSETPDDILFAGELAESSGDNAAAEAAYRRLLAADPQNQDATAALTHLLQHQKPADAEALLTAALAKDPGNPTLNAQLANLYEQQNKPEEALPIAEKLHADHPEDPAITRLLARVYSSNQDYDKALPLYASLTAASPNDPTLLDDNADALIHLKRYAEAETLLKRAVAHPDAFPSKNALGDAASRLAFAASVNNDPNVTLQALTLRATVLPNSPSSLFLEATAHDKLHQYKQATDLYKQFLSVANGKFPNEEWEARHRLIALQQVK
jgi:tetratricopeptide (TPR) repeat protein